MRQQRCDATRRWASRGRAWHVSGGGRGTRQRRQAASQKQHWRVLEDVRSAQMLEHTHVMLLCARRRRNHHTTLALARADRCRAWLSNGRAVIGQWLRGLLEQRGLGGARWPWAERPQRAEAPPAEGSSQRARFFRSHVCTGVGTQARPACWLPARQAPRLPGTVRAPRLHSTAARHCESRAHRPHWPTAQWRRAARLRRRLLGQRVGRGGWPAARRRCPRNSSAGGAWISRGKLRELHHDLPR